MVFGIFIDILEGVEAQYLYPGGNLGPWFSALTIHVRTVLNLYIFLEASVIGQLDFILMHTRGNVDPWFSQN